MKKQQTLYCSLDIETTGFDPLADEVLEVGMVFFTLGKKGFEIKREWTQVFKPSKPVPPKILGLTGIRLAELESAPLFKDFREDIQRQVEGVVIVGHNVVFDIKFLEAFGIKFSGKSIDTLELVQWILPTHHSYNLENLMHYFNVIHKEAHRALADAKAALNVLEKMMGVFSGFPKALKVQIISLSEGRGLLWQPFLEVGWQAPKASFDSDAKFKLPKPSLGLEKNTIYDFGMASDEEILYKCLAAIKKSKKKVLLVLKSQQQVLKLWKQGLASPVLGQEFLFDPIKFSVFIKKSLNPLEFRFALKILVWQHTSWQNSVLCDLNFSAFGAQFRELVSKSETTYELEKTVLACDFSTFLKLEDLEPFCDRRLTVFGLSELESAISFNLSQQVSWSKMIYLLKSIYNPELSVGEKRHKLGVEEMLASTDLFFGLVNALLQSDPPGFKDIAIDDVFKNTEQFSKIGKAAQTYAKKLLKFSEEIKSENLKTQASNLEAFFEDEANRVKWLEIAQNRCAFFSSPLKIDSLVKNAFQPFSEVVILDALGVPEICQYFVKRLGLKDFSFIGFYETPGNPDLFSGLAKFECLLPAKAFSNPGLLSLLKKEKLPAAVLFSGPMQIKDFYEPNLDELKSFSFLLNQALSGGTNKLFRNFSIHENSLLLVSDRFVLKFLSQNSPQSVSGLSLKTLVVLHLPFEQFTHPYQKAVSECFENSFEEYSLPRALLNFHRLIQFFFSRNLKKLYVWDSKMDKSYAGVFKKYLKALPKVKVVEKYSF